jgi:hypothetical protein
MTKRAPFTALIALVLLAFPFLAAAQPVPSSQVSGVTAVEAEAPQDAGVWNGVRYVKIAGVMRGVARGKDIGAVRNLASHANGAGEVAYSSRFELIVPASGEKPNAVIYVDSENRGGAISQNALGGFLQNHATSYARVQWKTGYSAGVPADAQGLGLVIMRDFARALSGRTSLPAVNGTAYPKMILGGISQSAWFVNSFIAEGFNVDPATGGKVFDAAIAIDGIGNWLGINQMAADLGVAPLPYVVPNGAPMERTTLLRRPATDPLYIDVANYTDFYRLRAGLTSTTTSTPAFRRYDWPSAHANGAAARCGYGRPVNPLRYPAYFRALVWNVEKAIGVRAARSAPGLPASTVFTLGPTPPASPLFNPLPGAHVRVPVVDKDGWPVGGVRFPEAENPTGRPEPASIPPSDTSSIDNTCGNSGGWQPWTATELTARYGGKAQYLAAYAKSLDALIAAGFVLAEERAAMVKAAEANWPAA